WRPPRVGAGRRRLHMRLHAALLFLRVPQRALHHAGIGRAHPPSPPWSDRNIGLTPDGRGPAAFHTGGFRGRAFRLLPAVGPHRSIGLGPRYDSGNEKTHIEKRANCLTDRISVCHLDDGQLLDIRDICSGKTSCFTTETP